MLPRYGFKGTTFTLNALFRHFANDCPLMSPSELHEALRCFSMDVPLEQCADIIRDFMRNHKDGASGGLDHAEFVRFVLELDNPDEFKHIGAGSILSRGLRLTHNDSERHDARVEELKVLRERKNADAAGDISVLVNACRKHSSGVGRMEKAMRLKDVGRSGTINLRHFIDILTETFRGDVTITNARRVAGIFDDDMAGYVSYERLIDTIRQQMDSTNCLSASLPGTPGSRAQTASIEQIKADFADGKSVRDLAENLRRKICSKIRNSASEFRQAFELLDRDGSGSIALEELNVVIERVLCMPVPKHVAAKLFEAIDRNKNGSLHHEL